MQITVVVVKERYLFKFLFQPKVSEFTFIKGFISSPTAGEAYRTNADNENVFVDFTTRQIILSAK